MFSVAKCLHFPTGRRKEGRLFRVFKEFFKRFLEFFRGFKIFFRILKEFFRVFLARTKNSVTHLDPGIASSSILVSGPGFDSRILPNAQQTSWALWAVAARTV